MHRKRRKQLKDTLKTLDLTEYEETENGLWTFKPQWDLDCYIRKAAAIVKARSAL